MTIPIFPTLPGMGFPTRSPIWSTLKHRSVSGKTSALQEWTAPIYRFEVPINVLREAQALSEWEEMSAFYNTVGGGAQLFEFDFPNDSVATNQSCGVGDGIETDFQLARSLGGFVEPVFAPTITEVTLNGVPTVAYTESGGLVTFTAAPAVGETVRWTGTFGWLCRFDEDSIDFAEFAYQFWELKRLTFTSDKL